MKRIRSNDVVQVIAGKSKGYIGKVLRVIEDRIVVEGANPLKKHVKPNPSKNEPGGIKTIDGSIHVSNVALYDSEAKKRSKVGYRFIEKDGKSVKVRYFKSTNKQV